MALLAAALYVWDYCVSGKRLCWINDGFTPTGRPSSLRLLTLMDYVLPPVWYVAVLIKYAYSFLAATKQFYDWFSPYICPSVRPSVHPSHLFHYVPIIISSFTYGNEIMHTAWSSIEDVPYCFWRSSVKISRSQGMKNRRFWPEFGVSGS